ncbi:hypothetical protein A1O7_10155 [Cladophialophora yegresii CBS 114405]|uniref:t-SNARE coiled-coil homology domain-containing protein n=1 Tax=Cladophialophora yegresii CBS 114405 TaxID=1182544 RepID=W9W8D7_9EURO|nr:uncharacterized protein A1O7_10155 [Cladophialophora yegresii CBS 114405]EXJ54814.1 hypothetical protein A1O7_10155 [Cladophialophora yegresii CBS 114405]
MSLTTALRPVGLPFGDGSRRESSVLDNLSTRPFQHEVNYINLDRTLIRYQHLILLTPSPSAPNSTELTPLQRQIQAELWSSLPYHRTKWLRNVEGARTSLLQLERKAQNIRIQRSKHEAIKDLAEKRAVIKRLRNRIEEIGREVEMLGTDNRKPPFRDVEGETVYDFLQKHGGSRGLASVIGENTQDALLEEGKTVTKVEEEPSSTNNEGEMVEKEELFGSSHLRRRGKGPDEAHQPPAQTSGFSNLPATERSLLDSSRMHEDITASLVNMAAQLKQEQRKLQFSLEQDKGILGRAIEGLDASLSGMEAASKNMKFLQRMSEEEGWLGRLKLYAMIFGMWIVAFLLVFVCPKLRFG